MSLAPPRIRIGRFWLSPLDAFAAVVAAAWLAVSIFMRPVGDFGVETDFYGDLAVFAREWMSGDFSPLSGYRGPGYYVVLGLFGKLLGDFFLAGKVLSSISAAVAVRLVGALGERLFGFWVAVFASLFLASNLVLNTYAIRACTDPFFLMLVTLGLWIALASKLNKRWAFTGGAVAAVAWLTRYNGIFLLISLLMAIAFRSDVKRRGRAALLALAVWAALAVPWHAYLANETGSPFWNRNVETVATELLVGDAIAATNAPFMSYVGIASYQDVLAIDFGGALASLSVNLLSHAWLDVNDLVGVPWALLGVLGFGLAWRRWLQRPALVLLVAMFLAYTSTLPAFYNPRFSLPLLVWWALGFGTGIEWMLSVVNQRTRSTQFPAPFIAVTLVLVTFAGNAYIHTVSESSDLGGPKVLKQLAQESLLTPNRFGKDTPIAARKPHLGYYLGTPTLRIGTGSFDDLRRRGIQYLLVSDAEVAHFPALLPLLGPPRDSEPVAGLHHIASVRSSDTPVRAASLWAILDAAPWKGRPTATYGLTVSVPDGLSRAEFMRVRLAKWELLYGDVQKSSSRIAGLSDRARNHWTSQLARGDQLFQQQRFRDAHQIYRGVAALTHAPEQTLPRQLATLTALGDESAARQLWRDAINQGAIPFQPSDAIDRALSAANDNDPVIALGILRGIIAEAPVGHALSKAATTYESQVRELLRW